MYPGCEHSFQRQKLQVESPADSAQISEIRIGSGLVSYMGGCQNSGPFLGPYYNTAPNI